MDGQLAGFAADLESLPAMSPVFSNLIGVKPECEEALGGHGIGQGGLEFGLKALVVIAQNKGTFCKNNVVQVKGKRRSARTCLRITGIGGRCRPNACAQGQTAANQTCIPGVEREQDGVIRGVGNGRAGTLRLADLLAGSFAVGRCSHAVELVAFLLAQFGTALVLKILQVVHRDREDLILDAGKIQNLHVRFAQALLPRLVRREDEHLRGQA